MMYRYVLSILRGVMLAILCAMPLCAIPLCQSHTEQLKLWGGTLLQLVSLHTGVRFNAAPVAMPMIKEVNKPIPIASFHPLLGASVGILYLYQDDDRLFDYGMRVRYLFSKATHAYHNSHDFGLLWYIHPFPNAYHKSSGAIQTHTDCEGMPDGYPTPFSFVLGGGIRAQNNPNGRYVGGYVEGGISLLKWLPINLDILYRFSFYPNGSLRIDVTTHSIQIIFTLL